MISLQEINIDLMITISRLIENKIKIPYKLFILTFWHFVYLHEGFNETFYSRIKYIELSDLIASANVCSNAHARDLLWQPRAVVK